MKWRCGLLFLVLVLLTAPATAQDSKYVPLVGEVKFAADGDKLTALAVLADPVRQRYEEIEIMARLLDRGLSRDARVGPLADPIRGAAFAPDGKTLATGSMDGSVRLWDVHTGKQLAAHAGHGLSGMEGVYLKGQGVVYTTTVPLHFQKPVAGPARPAPKPLTEWERVRKELHGEKVEAEKAKARDDASIADAVLKVLADNGKNLTQVPEGEGVTVALTLLSVPACVSCHSSTGGSGRGTMGGGGSGMGGGFSGGMRSSGTSTTGGTTGISSGTNSFGPPLGSSSSSGTGSFGSSTGSSTGGTNTGGSATTDSAAARADLRKYLLLGDLAMKQNDFPQAADAYQKATTVRNLPRDSAAELELIEAGTKWARALIAQGKTPEAEKVIQAVVRLTERLGSGERPAKPAAGKPEVPLPAKLVVTVPKKVLDQVGAGKMTFDEFRKAATVEHLTFDKATPGKP